MTRKKLVKKDNVLVKKFVVKVQRETLKRPSLGWAQQPSQPEDTVYLHKGSSPPELTAPSVIADPLETWGSLTGQPSRNSLTKDLSKNKLK